jgi:predicted nucleic acid-binding protein
MVFIDSNVWIYALIASQDSTKSSIAQTLLHANQNEITLCSQVILEVCVNILRKGYFTEPQIRKFIENSYQDFTVIDVSAAILISASQLRSDYAFSYFDSIIVATALAANATILYSEDMQNGLVVDGRLTIVNPFATP